MEHELHKLLEAISFMFYFCRQKNVKMWREKFRCWRFISRSRRILWDLDDKRGIKVKNMRKRFPTKKSDNELKQEF